MGPEAIRLMQAIKHSYPGVHAGDVIEPFGAAAQFPDADLNPYHPGYQVALRELQEADVLREVPPDHVSAPLMGMNPQYEVTSEGARRISNS